MSQETIWRPIVGYEGLYDISNAGEVRNFRGRILRPQKCTNHYRECTLWRDKAPKRFLIHRLVAMAFHPNPLGKPDVNHKDLDRANNAASNLEWATEKENMRHAIALGVIEKRPGSLNNRTHLKESTVLEIREKHRNGASTKDLSIEYRTAHSTMSYLLNRRTWTHI